MNVLTFDTEEQIGIAAGYYMCGQVLQKPDSVLGLATGSTPLKPYAHMIKLYQDGAVDFSKVTTFNLDEYCKLDVKDKNSYHSFMYENLFDTSTFLMKTSTSSTATQKIWTQNVRHTKKKSKSQAELTFSFSALVQTAILHSMNLPIHSKDGAMLLLLKKVQSRITQDFSIQLRKYLPTL